MIRRVYDFVKAEIPKPVKELLLLLANPAINALDFYVNHRPIHFYPSIRGMIGLEEKEYLYEQARKSHGNIVELGCYAGLSAYFLGMGAKKPGSHVYSIDPFDTCTERQMAERSRGSEYLDKGRKPSLNQVKATIRRCGLSDVVTLIQGFSYDVVKDWSKPIDLLFIDANHRYEDVLRDYNDWSRFIPPNGLILFHDSCYPEHGYESVTRVVREVIVPPQWEIIDRVHSITAARRLRLS